MKIAIAYKGVFNIHYQNVMGADDNIINAMKETIKNHDTVMSSLFDLNNADYFFSTYETDKKIDSLYIEKYKPKYYGYVECPSRGPEYTFVCQLMHHRNLIDRIKEQEKITGSYDMFIFTRTDAHFNSLFSELNIDDESFNLTFRHSSGNCDDNFIMFSRKHFELFSKCIDLLCDRHLITHQINHILSELEVPINYIKELDQKNNSTYGHDMFKLIRLEQNCIIFDFDTLIDAFKKDQDEVKNFLSKLHNYDPWCQRRVCVSTHSKEYTKTTLQQMGLLEYLEPSDGAFISIEDFNVNGLDINRYNLHPDIVAIDPERCIIVESSEEGIRTAKSSVIPESNVWEIKNGTDLSLNNFNKFVNEKFIPKWRMTLV